MLRRALSYVRGRLSWRKREPMPFFTPGRGARILEWPETGSFDYVVMQGTLNDVQNVKAALSEANRVLREGGRVYVRGCSRNTAETGHRRRITKSHLARWFDWTGFEMLAFRDAIKRRSGEILPEGAREGEVFSVGEKRCTY